MLQSDLKLDGNALAGLLQELFGVEMTVADAHCRSCRQVNQMGRAEVYMNAPGVVARCPACGQVLMRVVRGGGRVWLDLSGIRCLELTDPAESAAGG